MGTKLDFFLTPVPSGSLLELARALQPLCAQHPPRGEGAVSFFIANFSGTALLCTELPDGINPEVAGRLLSQLVSPSLYQHYSDTLGEAGYIIFREGHEEARNTSPIPGSEPMFPRFQEGMRLAFPTWGTLGPEEVLDILYGEASTNAAFLLSRDGAVLPAPEPYVRPQPTPWKPSLLAREFQWGRRPRAWLRVCAAAFGIFMALMLLFAVGWWALEMLRS